MITSADNPFYIEAVLAEKLGYSREDLRFVRRTVLKKEADWSTIGREVVYTLPAVMKVLEHVSKRGDGSQQVAALDLTDCLLAVPEKKEAEVNGVAHVASEPLRTLTVRRQLPNQRLLLAADDAGQVFNVRVPTNKNFRPLMTLRARQVDALTYQMEGRCPRSPGRY